MPTQYSIECAVWWLQISLTQAGNLAKNAQMHFPPACGKFLETPIAGINWPCVRDLKDQWLNGWINYMMNNWLQVAPPLHTPPLGTEHPQEALTRSTSSICPCQTLSPNQVSQQPPNSAMMHKDTWYEKRFTASLLWGHCNWDTSHTLWLQWWLSKANLM